MKIVVFHKNERVHEWFLNADDPNDIAFLITNCGHGFIRYGISDIRLMENKLDKLQWVSVENDELRRENERLASKLERITALSTPD